MSTEELRQEPMIADTSVVIVFLLITCIIIPQVVSKGSTNSKMPRNRNNNKETGQSSNRNRAADKPNVQQGTSTSDQKDRNVSAIGSHYLYRKPTYEEKLLIYLFEDYEPVARAVMDTDKTVTVSIDFVLLRIHGLDEKTQVLTTTGLVIAEWIDDRLTWNPAEFGYLTNIIVKAEKIWLPELAVMNGAEELMPDFDRIRVLLHYDGRLHWEPGGIFKTTCDIEIAYFPFDGQVCQLLIGAYSYHSTRMNITNASSAISTHDFRVNGEWQVVSTTAEWGITVLNTPGESKSTDQIRPQEINAQWQTAGNSSRGGSDMDDEMIDDESQSSFANFTVGDIKQRPNGTSTPPAGYAHVVFTLNLKRRCKFYVMNIVLPCVMLSVLIMIGFCLPPEAGEKISLGISVLLAFTVFLLMIADNIPRTSLAIPLIVIYLMTTMTLGTVSVCMTVLVLNIHHSGSQRNRQVPGWVRQLVLVCLARLVCYDTPQLVASRTNKMSSPPMPPSLTGAIAAKSPSRRTRHSPTSRRLPDPLSSALHLSVSSRPVTTSRPAASTTATDDSRRFPSTECSGVGTANRDCRYSYLGSQTQQDRSGRSKQSNDCGVDLEMDDDANDFDKSTAETEACSPNRRREADDDARDTTKRSCSPTLSINTNDNICLQQQQQLQLLQQRDMLLMSANKIDDKLAQYRHQKRDYPNGPTTATVFPLSGITTTTGGVASLGNVARRRQVTAGRNGAENGEKMFGTVLRSAFDGHFRRKLAPKRRCQQLTMMSTTGGPTADVVGLRLSHCGGGIGGECVDSSLLPTGCDDVTETVFGGEKHRAARCVDSDPDDSDDTNDDYNRKRHSADNGVSSELDGAFAGARRHGSTTGSDGGEEEWQEVARVLDRTFFWTIFALMTLSGVGILLYPVYSVENDILSAA